MSAAVIDPTLANDVTHFLGPALAPGLAVAHLPVDRTDIDDVGQHGQAFGADPVAGVGRAGREGADGRGEEEGWEDRSHGVAPGRKACARRVTVTRR